MPQLEVEFLADGGASAEAVAAKLTGFIGAASHRLDVAIYDFDASEGGAATVADALESALLRGVQVRVAFNLERRPPGPPRPPKGDPKVIAGLSVPTRAIGGNGG